MTNLFEEMVEKAIKEKLTNRVNAEAERRIAQMMVPPPPSSSIPLPPPPSSSIPLPPGVVYLASRSTRAVRHRKCPAGSWIGLSPTAGGIISRQEDISRARGADSGRFKAYKKLQELLAAGPAPRSVVTKTLEGLKVFGDGASVSGALSWMVNQNLLVVVSAPAHYAT